MVFKHAHKQNTLDAITDLSNNFYIKNNSLKTLNLNNPKTEYSQF